MNHAGQVIHPNSMGRANEHREAMRPSRPLLFMSIPTTFISISFPSFNGICGSLAEKELPC